MTNVDPSRHRSIRSFVRRSGRLTQAQQRALGTLWERYGVEIDRHLLPLNQLFGRIAPRILEIGFGDGESLLAMAGARPENDFLGIEVHRPGIGHLLLRADALGLTNVRVICADAQEALNILPDACLERIQVFFPDPWPKKRHHKRRLIQPAFVAVMARTLKSGGYLHLATDWEEYAHWMLTVLDACEALHNTVSGGFAPRPVERPLTKFERRGQLLGHEVWDLLFRRR
ncbi:MAG: tRNA (guanosine(46)-N7)-methyltransferase TrmB [Candidatus Competibacteraceae bacterium]